MIWSLTLYDFKKVYLRDLFITVQSQLAELAMDSTNLLACPFESISR